MTSKWLLTLGLTLTLTPRMGFAPVTTRFRVWATEAPHQEVCILIKRMEQADDWSRLFCQPMDSRLWTEPFQMPGWGHYRWEAHMNGKVEAVSEQNILPGLQDGQ